MRNRNLDAFEVPFSASRRCDNRSQRGAVVFVELDTCQEVGYAVSLEWDRDTGETQIVLDDIGDASLLVFPVPDADAGEAFRHPLRYAP